MYSHLLFNYDAASQQDQQDGLRPFTDACTSHNAERLCSSPSWMHANGAAELSCISCVTPAFFFILMRSAHDRHLVTYNNASSSVTTNQIYMREGFVSLHECSSSTTALEGILAQQTVSTSDINITEERKTSTTVSSHNVVAC